MNRPASLSAAAHLVLAERPAAGRYGISPYGRPEAPASLYSRTRRGSAWRSGRRGTRSKSKCDFAPRLSTARSVRPKGLSTTGERRRDGGTIDARRTASHDPRICRTSRRRRKVWHQTFSFPPLRRRLSLGLRAALAGGWPPMHACGRSLCTGKEKWGPESPGTSRYPLPAREPFTKERIHHGTEI